MSSYIIEVQMINSQFKYPPPSFAPVRWAVGETPLFKGGDRVRIALRFPIGHYRAPRYIRGKTAVVECVIEPPAVSNEEEGFGRNAGSKRHYYRVKISMTELWRPYTGSPRDELKIEIFETWLKRA